MTPTEPGLKSLLDEVRSTGRIRVAARWDITPEQYLDPTTGEPAGVVGKVARQLASDLGVNAEFVELSWDDHIPALLDGRVDICLKHTNTPARAFHVAFARGHLEKYVGRIVVRRDRQWRKEADLDSKDRVIAVTSGSHQEFQAISRYPSGNLRLYASAHDGMEAVSNGDADACLADAWIDTFLLLHPECEVLVDEAGEVVVTSIDYAHPCIRKGDQEFLNWLDNWMLYHEAQGTLDRLIREAYEEHRTNFSSILAEYATTEGSKS